MESTADEVRPFVPEVSDSGIGHLDWFGNTTLHHCYANDRINLESIEDVLRANPEYASSTNQFGRIPLHYALDRINADIAGIKILLHYYPDGVRLRDNDSITPYDVAVKWKHSNEIKRLLLDIDPSLDPPTHFLLRFGCIARAYNLLFRKRPRKKKQSRSRSSANNEIHLQVAVTDNLDDDDDDDDHGSERSDDFDNSYHRSSNRNVTQSASSNNILSTRQDEVEKSSYGLRSELLENSLSVDASAAADTPLPTQQDVIIENVESQSIRI